MGSSYIIMHHSGVEITAMVAPGGEEPTTGDQDVVRAS